MAWPPMDDATMQPHRHHPHPSITAHITLPPSSCKDSLDSLICNTFACLSSCSFHRISQQYHDRYTTDNLPKTTQHKSCQTRPTSPQPSPQTSSQTLTHTRCSVISVHFMTCTLRVQDTHAPLDVYDRVRQTNNTVDTQEHTASMGSCPGHQ